MFPRTYFSRRFFARTYFASSSSGTGSTSDTFRTVDAMVESDIVAMLRTTNEFDQIVITDQPFEVRLDRGPSVMVSSEGWDERPLMSNLVLRRSLYRIVISVLIRDQSDRSIELERLAQVVRNLVARVPYPPGYVPSLCRVEEAMIDPKIGAPFGRMTLRTGFTSIRNITQ